MRIGIDMGHTLSGVGTGAGSKYASETQKNREVGQKLINILKEKGHIVVNCTVDRSQNDLSDRVAIANAQDLDLFVSLHLNAYVETEKAMGVETYTYSTTSSARPTAERIQSNLVKSIGWTNRGVKTANYYVLRSTKAPAILVELGFCDSKKDMELWNTEKIAVALYEAITNTKYTTTNTSSKGDLHYRVIVGSYKDKSNAISQQDKLKKAGFDSFLEAYYK